MEGHKTQESSSTTTPCLSPPSSLKELQGQKRESILAYSKRVGAAHLAFRGLPQNPASYSLPVQSRKLIRSEQQSPTDDDHSSTCTSDHHPLGKYTSNQIIKIDRHSSVPRCAQEPASLRSHGSSSSSERVQVSQPSDLQTWAATASSQQLGWVTLPRLEIGVDLGKHILQSPRQPAQATRSARSGWGKLGNAEGEREGGIPPRLCCWSPSSLHLSTKCRS